MSETITKVKAEHGLDGPFPNGTSGCHTRWATGFCSGVQTAEWLNSLGPDDAPYFSSGVRPHITNLTVRLNWLRASNTHIVPENEIEWKQCANCHGLGKVLLQS